MQPANLLVLMADEHNARMLGAAGHPFAKTPNLDALAKAGTRFTNAYTNCPICVPARASFATGRYINEIEYWDNSIAYDGRVKSWGHRLQEAGIRVESIGKLHYRNENDPAGFDVQHIPLHVKDGLGMVQLSIRKQFPNFVRPKAGKSSIVESAGTGESEYTRYDRNVSKIACDWLREAAADQREPWVLFVSFVTPHYPLVAPEEFMSMYSAADLPTPKFVAGCGYKFHPWLENFSRGNDAGLSGEKHKQALAAYLGLCSFVDAQIGKVLDTLREVGLNVNTRVLYTSDHGENAGARGLWGKSNHYEEADKIPLILAGPGVRKAATCDTPVSLVDVYPTVLDSVGLPAAADHVPGRSLFEIASGEPQPERVVFSEYHAAGSPSAAYMLRRGDFKLIYYVGYDPELFNLKDDPEESRNLADDPAYKPVVAELEGVLRSIVDPEDADRRANLAQQRLIESLGGPDKVMANLVTEKNYTPIPEELLGRKD